MPTYEYICSACNHAFERFESITAKPNKECEKCGKKKAERQISAGAGLIFKGSGFYVTDYKGAGKPDAKATDSKPAETKAADTSTAASATTPAPATPAPAAKSDSSSKSSGGSKSSSKKK
jgi:putative FmdB family regulatory protein